MTGDGCKPIDSEDAYNATEDVQKLARYMQRRDAREWGVIVDGEVSPSWEDIGDAGREDYLRDAGWVIAMVLGLLGYRPPATR